MLVDLKEIIAGAEEGGYCVPAFNVYNLETIMGVMDAAEAEKAPVILQVYPRLINEEVGYYLAPAILAAAKKAKVPVCFHLDHGSASPEVRRALYWGATGIMFDGSEFSFAENVAKTRAVVEIGETLGIGVEGEIGHVGKASESAEDAVDEFTNPEEAARFVRETGVTCLAILIGNAHGHYKKPPCLDIPRLQAIREATGNTPLVLHGGSGIPDDQVKAAIRAGVRKMNVGTDVCCAFASGALAALNDPERSIAVDIFMKGAIAAVRDLARDKIRLVGADGRA